MDETDEDAEPLYLKDGRSDISNMSQGIKVVKSKEN